MNSRTGGVMILHFQILLSIVCNRYGYKCRARLINWRVMKNHVAEDYSMVGRRRSTRFIVLKDTGQFITWYRTVRSDDQFSVSGKRFVYINICHNSTICSNVINFIHTERADRAWAMKLVMVMMVPYHILPLFLVQAANMIMLYGRSTMSRLLWHILTLFCRNNNRCVLLKSFVHCNTANLKVSYFHSQGE